jgi:drug/metabolite transporter (DMT)-like permease
MSGTALFLVPALIWGTTWYAITWQLGVVAPEVSVVYRFAAASVLLAAGCAATGRSLAFSRRDHAYLAGIGLLMICLNYNLIYWAERIVVSGLVAVAYSTIVFMTPIGMRLAFGAPLQPRLLGAAALGVTGVALMFLPELREARAGGVTAYGIALVLTAALACALGNLIVVRNHDAGIPTIPGTAWTMIYGTAFAVAVALGSGSAWTFDPRPAYVLSLGYLAVCGSVVAFVTYFALLRRVGAGPSSYTAIATLPVDAGRRGRHGAGGVRHRARTAHRGRALASATMLTCLRILVFAILFYHVNIVNEAGIAERGGGQHDEQVRVIVAFGVRNAEREAVADRDVVDLPAPRRKLHPARGLEVRVIRAAAGNCVGDAAQHAVEVRCLGPFRGGQVVVARGQREAVRCTDRLGGDDLDRHVELLHHAADDLELLTVLLAEHRDVGLHEVEQLEDDRAHAVEESGPRRALELLAKRRRLDAVDLRRRVHLLFLRIEEHVDPFALEARAISLQRPRIAVEVLVGAELKAIDEDAGNDGVAVLAGDPAQGQMAIVQIAHRGDEGDALERREVLREFRGGMDDFHAIPRARRVVS